MLRGAPTCSSSPIGKPPLHATPLAVPLLSCKHPPSYWAPYALELVAVAPEDRFPNESSAMGQAVSPWTRGPSMKGVASAPEDVAERGASVLGCKNSAGFAVGHCARTPGRSTRWPDARGYEGHQRPSPRRPFLSLSLSEARIAGSGPGTRPVSARLSPLFAHGSHSLALMSVS